MLPPAPRATRAAGAQSNSMRVLCFASRALAAAGELDDAHSCYARALRISPIDPASRAHHGGHSRGASRRGTFRGRDRSGSGRVAANTRIISRCCGPTLQGLWHSVGSTRPKVQASLLMNTTPGSAFRGATTSRRNTATRPWLPRSSIGMRAVRYPRPDLPPPGRDPGPPMRSARRGAKIWPESRLCVASCRQESP